MGQVGSIVDVTLLSLSVLGGKFSFLSRCRSSRRCDGGGGSSGERFRPKASIPSPDTPSSTRTLLTLLLLSGLLGANRVGRNSSGNTGRTGLEGVPDGRLYRENEATQFPCLGRFVSPLSLRGSSRKALGLGWRAVLGTRRGLGHVEGAQRERRKEGQTSFFASPPSRFLPHVSPQR